MEAGEDVFDLEAGSAGARDEFADDLIELPLAFDVIAFNLLGADEGAGALVGLNDAEDFEFAVSADDGIGIDREIDGGLAYGGELITGAEGTEDDSVADLFDELTVDGDAAGEVETELKGNGLGGRWHLDK